MRVLARASTQGVTQALTYITGKLADAQVFDATESFFWRLPLHAECPRRCSSAWVVFDTFMVECSNDTEVQGVRRAV